VEETRIIDFDDATPVPTQALPAGTLLHDGKFGILSQVGSGGFGITYLAKDNYLDRSVVIKECFPEAFCFRFGTQVSVNAPRLEAQYKMTVEMFMREARSIAKLRHPNVVTAHQVFEENGTAYMVLDLIEGRDLADIIESDEEDLSPRQVHEILVKVLDAMSVVHGNDLLHRDISPDNILLDRWGSPTLIDFGAAREEASKKTKAVSSMLVVKDGYSPHEFYISGTTHGPFSDLYALGATMYHLISGEAPADSQTRVAALTNNEADPCVPLVGRFPQYEEAFLAAIDLAMRLAPKERIQSAAEWMGLIEQEERKKVATVKIPDKPGLGKTISELIEETNKHVLSTPIEPAVVEQKPIPKTRETSRGNAPFTPEWIEEFNRETREKAEAERAAAEAAAKAARDAAIAAIKEEARLAREEEARKRREQEQAAHQSRNILDWVSRKSG